MNLMTVEPIDLSGDTVYMNPGTTCRVVGAYSVISGEAGATGAKTITISDGTTDVGVISIALSSALGVVDKMVLDATSKGAVEFNVDTPIKLVGAGSGAGLANVTLVLDTFHSDC